MFLFFQGLYIKISDEYILILEQEYHPSVDTAGIDRKERSWETVMRDRGGTPTETWSSQEYDPSVADVARILQKLSPV